MKFDLGMAVAHEQVGEVGRDFGLLASGEAHLEDLLEGGVGGRAGALSRLSSSASLTARSIGSAAVIETYIGAAVAVAAVAMIDNTVANNHRAAGASAAEALAAGVSAAALTMAILSAAGVLLVVLLRRHRPAGTRAIDRAAAAAATVHTIPTEPTTTASAIHPEPSVPR